MNGDGDAPFDPFPPLVIPSSPPRSPGVNRRERPRRTPRDRRAEAVPIFIPPPPPPTGVVIPFPVPQEPIPPEVVAPAILTRILLGGSIAGVVVVVIEASRRAIERKKKAEEEREAEATLEGIRRQNERIARDKVVKTTTEAAISMGSIVIAPRPLPEIPPAPARQPAPIFDPIPVELPAPTAPEPLPAPVPIEIPAPSPVPVPRPVVVPATLPSSLPAPTTVPGLFPFRLPAFFPIPQIVPRTSPRIAIGDQFPPSATNPLTTLQQGQITSFAPQTAALPQADTAERCKEVKRRRRRKGKCFEGFYREFPGKTEFTEWREVDCVTRRATRGNVINFPN